MSLGSLRVIEPLARGMRIASVVQIWGVMVVIALGGLASYLAVKYLGSEDVTSRGSLVIGHVAAATLAIGIGGWQFLPVLRSRPRWHRWVGRIYIAASLFASSVAIFRTARMAHLDAGLLGLAVTALLWISTTTAGLWAICGRSFVAHRRWMIRSYALALTQVTLRFYSRGLANLGIEESATAYALLVWAALISNLGFAEWIACTLSKNAVGVRIGTGSPYAQSPLRVSTCQETARRDEHA